MPGKRLLYFTARQVWLYRWRAGRLHAEAVFANDEQGASAFSAVLARARHALYTVLVDLVDEEFQTDKIPYVRGSDRRALLERKLAQRYRDLSLALTLSLGYESGPRKEEHVLFASFMNTQQFQPWLAAFRAHQARLVGVYSVPLVSAQLCSRIGITERRYLLVSLQRAGMRQSFIDDGCIRFSRLGQIEGDEPRERATRVAAEAVRIHQFLINARLLPREAGPLPVVILLRPQNRAGFQAACADTEQLKFVLVDTVEAARRTGLKSFPGDMLSERFFLHSLATALPAEQFAADRERRFYHLWRARVALLATGAAVLGFGALLSGLRLVETANVARLAQHERDAERTLAARYSRLQAQFPKLPASAENLKALVNNYRVVESQSVSPEAMFAHISAALERNPRIELDRIDWHVGGQRRPPAAGAGRAPSPRPEKQPAAQRVQQLVEISGRVSVVPASDYRAIAAAVNRFVEALGQRPGMEIVSTQLPFELGEEKSVSGQIGTERPQEIPRFTVVAAKRLGP